MNNSRITPKERNLIKGAIRRVFARSELRQQVVKESDFKEHSDPSRKRVKNWCLCPICEKPTPRSYMQVDHIIPLIPIDKSLEDMSWDDIVNRLWCDKKNLMPICKECHLLKTKEEKKARTKIRKLKKQADNSGD